MSGLVLWPITDIVVIERSNVRFGSSTDLFDRSNSSPFNAAKLTLHFVVEVFSIVLLFECMPLNYRQIFAMGKNTPKIPPKNYGHFDFIAGISWTVSG